jgi:hypothetical protein
MDNTRINIQRLLMSILITLLLPLALAVLVDYSLGWMPWTTIGASLIFIPLSTIVVTRATLSELDKIIRQVAPVEPENGVTNPEPIVLP